MDACIANGGPSGWERFVRQFQQTVLVSIYAGLAQLVEQLICNQQVISSSLIAGSI
jgi:hypothetical protein